MKSKINPTFRAGGRGQSMVRRTWTLAQCTNDRAIADSITAIQYYLDRLKEELLLLKNNWSNSC